MAEGDAFDRRSGGDPMNGSRLPQNCGLEGLPVPAALTGSRFPGHQHLAGGTPEELVERLVRTDPFDLRVACRRELTDRALLLDEARLFMRSTARMALEARTYAGHPPLVVWVDQIVEASIRALLREDRESSERGLLPDSAWDPASQGLLEVLPIEPSMARSVCVVFNALHVQDRRIFQALVLAGQSLDDCSARTGLPPQHLRASVRETLARLCAPAPISRDSEGVTE